MSDLAAVIEHFPKDELTIRRLYLRVPEFRSLCEDYAAARSALERWHTDQGRVREFQQLIEEIETEIDEFIQGTLKALRPQREEET